MGYGNEVWSGHKPKYRVLGRSLPEAEDLSLSACLMQASGKTYIPLKQEAQLSQRDRATLRSIATSTFRG